MTQQQRPKPVDVGEIRARAVRPRGARGPHDDRWYWRAEVSRRMVWRGWATRGELPRILAQVLVDGVEAVDEHTQIEDIRTVKDLMEVWVGTTVTPRTDTALRTRKNDRNAAKRVTKGLGTYRLDRLGREALDQWVIQRQREGCSALTIRRDLGILRRAWTWGQQVGVCPRYDLPLPRLKAVNKRSKRTPTLGEVAEVVQYLEDHKPAWMSVCLRLQAALGCRIGELATLTWEQVDLEAGLVELRGKTGSRVVPLRPDIVEMLEGLPRDRSTVLGKSWPTVINMGRQLQEAFEALNMERFTTHGLRRLAVDTLARSGVDVGTAAAILGHSPVVMLKAYRQVGLDERRRAVLELGRLPRGEIVSFPAVGGGGHRSRSQISGEVDED